MLLGIGEGSQLQQRAGHVEAHVAAIARPDVHGPGNLGHLPRSPSAHVRRYHVGAQLQALHLQAPSLDVTLQCTSVQHAGAAAQAHTLGCLRISRGDAPSG